MNYNPCLIPTLILATVLFFLSRRLWSTLKRGRPVMLLISLPLALPGILFVIYYLHWFDDAVWFYRFRAFPCTEFTAAGAGIFAGFLAAMMKRYKILSSGFLLCVLMFGIFIPHSKSVIFPLDYTSLKDQWVDGCCLQSCGATCGPASAATILKHHGINVTEKELAEECYSYVGGTEVWYIARALRKRGLQCEFTIIKGNLDHLPCPALPSQVSTSAQATSSPSSIKQATPTPSTTPSPVQEKSAKKMLSDAPPSPAFSWLLSSHRQFTF